MSTMFSVPSGVRGSTAPTAGDPASGRARAVVARRTAAYWAPAAESDRRRGVGTANGSGGGGSGAVAATAPPLPASAQPVSATAVAAASARPVAAAMRALGVRPLTP